MNKYLSKGSALIPILVLVFAIPILVSALTTQTFDIRKRAASGETSPSCVNLVNTQNQYFTMCRDNGYDGVCFNKNTSEYQGCTRGTNNDCTINNINASNNILCKVALATPTPVCKTGLISFGVDTSCENGGYRYMTFRCYDGYGRREGSSSSCKSSELWRSYAEGYCKGHSSCTQTPYPSPVSTPVLRTSTPYPTPTANNLPNNNPVITTNSLPIGFVGRKYFTSINTYDIDNEYKLDIIINNIPSGLGKGVCEYGRDYIQNRTTSSCSIVGTPTKPGNYKVEVIVKDPKGGSVRKIYRLRILPSLKYFSK